MSEFDFRRAQSPFSEAFWAFLALGPLSGFVLVWAGFIGWGAKFKAEPQLPVHKLLYRRRGLSHSLSHSVSQRLRIG
jgi:hypothetical protein